MRVVFMGTPDFAVGALKNIAEKHNVIAVITQKDKLGNRNKLTVPPVKTVAIELGIPVYQYDRISREGVKDLKEFNPDIAVTAAFGQILSREILSIPKFGVINIHASLLPKYRGSSPIQWAVINGDEYSGITIMQTAYEVDSGDIIKQYPLKIGTKETAGELFDRLAILGAEAVIDVLGDIELGRAEHIKQDESKATFCKMLTKQDGKIDFSKSSREIDCHVRGMTPWPSAFCEIDGMKFKIYSTQSIADNTTAEVGSVINADTKLGLVIKCKDGAVRLIEIQADGGKRMKDIDYLRGHSVKIGANAN